jgi:raffinose/stachyose/melibiose transport system permease protein
MNLKSRAVKLFNSHGALNILYLPVLVLLSVFVFYPFIRGLMISFTDWNGFSLYYNWVGFYQYGRIFTDRNIANIVGNTFIYAIGSTIFQNIFGICFAILLDKAIKGKDVVRVIIYTPVMISGLIMGYIWYFMFRFNGGAINEIVQLFGHKPIEFLGLPTITVLIITAVNVFQYSGQCMLIYLAGLQTIPKDYYEAASLDGAKGLSMFRFITFPLIMPCVTINVVLNLIGGLKLFDVIKAMTNGGPGYMTQSLSTIMYQLYFGSQDAGYAATLGNVMFVFIAIISITMLVFLRNKEVEY